MDGLTEWRVSGLPVEGRPPYEAVWSPLSDPVGDAEVQARSFFALLVNPFRPWVDGPYLERRTVTAWERVES